jgi:hypothetical protein
MIQNPAQNALCITKCGRLKRIEAEPYSGDDKAVLCFTTLRTIQ